jgi:serine/threonine protein kinase
MLENLDSQKPNYRIIRTFKGGKSGNPVFRVSPDTDASDIQILKASPTPSDLKKEVEITRSLSKLFGTRGYNPIIQISGEGEVKYKNKTYYYYVMEDLTIDYRPLSQVLKEQCKTIDHTLMKKVFLNLFRTLRRMKERSWSHCDLHAENIFVDKKGRIKLIDFGLAQQNKCSKQRNVTEVIAKLMWLCKYSIRGYTQLIKQMATKQKVDSDMSMYITMLSMMYGTTDVYHLFIELKYLSSKIFQAHGKNIKPLLERFEIVLDLILNH